MKVNGTDYNVQSVTKRSEDDYVKFAASRYPHLSEEQVREVHRLAVAEKSRLEAESKKAEKAESKKADSPPGATEKEKAAASKK